MVSAVVGAGCMPAGALAPRSDFVRRARRDSESPEKLVGPWSSPAMTSP